MASQGVGNTKTRKIPNPPNVMIPNHHKRKYGSNTAKKIKGSNVAKNQKLNVEDHIASKPTGPRKKTYPPMSAPNIPLPTPAS
jgi:hypothetical protein